MTNTICCSDSLQALQLRHAARQSSLRGACFCDGVTEPEEYLIADIRDAEALAGEV